MPAAGAGIPPQREPGASSGIGANIVRFFSTCAFGPAFLSFFERSVVASSSMLGRETLTHVEHPRGLGRDGPAGCGGRQGTRLAVRGVFFAKLLPALPCPVCVVACGRRARERTSNRPGWPPNGCRSSSRSTSRYVGGTNTNLGDGAVALIFNVRGVPRSPVSGPGPQPAPTGRHQCGQHWVQHPDHGVGQVHLRPREGAPRPAVRWDPPLT